MATFVAQQEVSSSKIVAILLTGFSVKHILLAGAILVTYVLPFVIRLMLHF